MTPTQPLSPSDAKTVYDRMGRFLNTQKVFEGPFKEDLIAHADFGAARSVLEYGIGTGTFAERLLAHELPDGARYLGVDQSTTMIGLTRDRIAAWVDRASVLQSDGGPRIDAPDGGFDRFVSTYVFDLLSHDHIRTVLEEAHRLLGDGGRLCLAGLAHGQSGPERLVSNVIDRVWSLNPKLMGGCRPIEIAPFLTPDRWSIVYERTGSAWGVTSEVLVAEPVR